MTINLKEALATIINFIILLVILKVLFWNKIKLIMDEREKQVADRIEKSKAVLKEAEILKIASENSLKEARLEGKKITERRKEKADEIYNEIIENANKNSISIKEKAKREMETEKEKIEYQLKVESVDLAVNLSKQILEKELTEEVQRDLIDKFIEGLEIKNV